MQGLQTLHRRAFCAIFRNIGSFRLHSPKCMFSSLCPSAINFFSEEALMTHQPVSLSSRIENLSRSLHRRAFCAVFLNTGSFRLHSPKYMFSSLCSSDINVSSEEALMIDQPISLSSRVENLPGSKSIISAFQGWMADGFPVHRGEIFHAINRLRKLKMNKRALEVMEWVIRERPYKLNELDYSLLLEFTTKIHGISQGETLFTRIPQNFQNELLYNNLVLACLDKGVIRLSLDYMKKMRELGFPISYLAYNRLIILHSSPGRRKAIPRILTQMKADKVTPHPSTYNILLKIEADDHNIEGLSKVFNEMKKAKVEPSEITYCILATAHAVARLYAACEAYVEEVEKSKTGNNWSTFDVLLILYGYLGKQRKLEETWLTIQNFPFVRYKSFVLAIEAFGRTGQQDRAEELWLEMKSEKGLKRTEQFNSIISVYCRHGCLDKASELFKEMETNGCKANAITYRNLAIGCLKAGLVEEALKTLQIGSDQTASTWVRKSTPWMETTLLLVDMFADMGDIENANKLFQELRESRFSRYTFVYNTLLKAYVKAKVYCPDFLKNMIIRGARPDAETYSLLRLIEEFKT